MTRFECRLLPEHIHLVGIGGIGLSAIARILFMNGYTVSGSDMTATSITDGLRRQGVRVHIGHAAEQVAGAELVVMSSAIPPDNPEIAAARRAGITVVKRRELLGKMMAGYFGIAVAGTHGKTTTSAMIAVILEKLGWCPTFIVGGIVVDLGTNAYAGKGNYFVIEADEYDHTFLGLHPEVAVVTNVEMDHPDCYTDLAAMRAAYGAFLENVPENGHIIACADSPEAMRVLREAGMGTQRVVTYGLSSEADYVVDSFSPGCGGGVEFRILTRGEPLGRFSLGLSGVHNALNAAAALIAVGLCGIDYLEAGRVLEGFQGVLRRFQIKGDCTDITVIDDYAHHPTQVRATLAAARQRYPRRRIWAVFQPHTYSRTQALLEGLAASFGDADQVVVTDVYAARAHETATIRAEELVARIQHDHVRHLGTIDEAIEYLMCRLCPGDVLITLGAGDGYLVGERLLTRLEERRER